MTIQDVEQIATMPASHELNRLVAIKVMGWQCTETCRPCRVCETDFSRDRVSALKIVEFLARVDGPTFSLQRSSKFGWIASFSKYSASAETIELAICRAALLAVHLNPM